MNRFVLLLAPALFLAAAVGCAAKTSAPAPEAAAEEAAPAEEDASAEEVDHQDHVHADSDAAPPKAACESCAKGKSGETIWCTSCNAGYHNGEKVKCQGCWEAAQKGETHAHEEEAEPSEG